MVVVLLPTSVPQLWKSGTARIYLFWISFRLHFRTDLGERDRPLKKEDIFFVLCLDSQFSWRWSGEWMLLLFSPHLSLLLWRSENYKRGKEEMPFLLLSFFPFENIFFSARIGAAVGREEAVFIFCPNSVAGWERKTLQPLDTNRPLTLVGWFREKKICPRKKVEN